MESEGPVILAFTAMRVTRDPGLGVEVLVTRST
ncbi:hypothetical protein LINPERHAP1_LOCUS30737 [Linum perenne]